MIDIENLKIAAALLAMVEVAGVLLAADAVMRPRSSQAAIAWSVALITLPLATIPLYILFGRTRFHGYAEALREKETQVGKHLAYWVAHMAAAAGTHEGLEAVEHLVRGLTRIPFTRDNRAELLVDAEATYGAMLEAVSAADSYVLVQFYLVEEGAVASRMRDALIRRARCGVKVYFLYDELGCWKLPAAYLDALRDASVEVSAFRTTRGRRNRFQINFRNHRKLLVVDGRVGFIGGHNLSDDYLSYRDTHLKIEGPAAQHIQFSFLKDWYWATRRIPELSMAVEPAAEADQKVAIVNTGPADSASSCSALFATLAHSANRRLWLTSPYFVPDDVMVRALQAAALRGVDVRILLPGRADHRLVELASYTYYGEMLDCGVRLFRYQGRFMHQKVVLVDGLLAGVGTVNLDNRALYLNFEATALVADNRFARAVAVMLESDLAKCEPVDRAHFDAKPLRFRVAARIARLASPLL